MTAKSLLLRCGMLIAGASLCGAATGCMGGYAYPRYIAVPETAVFAPAKEVQAFRVDISERSTDFKPLYRRRVLSTLTIDKEGRLAKQSKLSVETAWGTPEPTGKRVFPEHQWNSMRVFLYRPGYKTITFGPSESHDAVTWLKAVTPEEQEAALDNLIAWDFVDLSPQELQRPKPPTKTTTEPSSAIAKTEDPTSTEPTEEATKTSLTEEVTKTSLTTTVEQSDTAKTKKPTNPAAEAARRQARFETALKELVPGAFAGNHRDSLKYVASEYERVSGLISWQQKDKLQLRYRLTDKAARLRFLANK